MAGVPGPLTPAQFLSPPRDWGGGQELSPEPTSAQARGCGDAEARGASARPSGRPREERASPPAALSFPASAWRSGLAARSEECPDGMVYPPLLGRLYPQRLAPHQIRDAEAARGRKLRVLRGCPKLGPSTAVPSYATPARARADWPQVPRGYTPNLGK